MKFWQQERKSFGAALTGISTFLRRERHGRFHLAAFIVACIMAMIFDCTQGEWMAIMLASALVFAAEMLNTAIEMTADLVDTQPNDQIKDLKDIAAGAVFVAATGAALVGVIIFLPRLLNLDL